MENIRIPRQGWIVVKKIGEGSHGAVYEIERTIGNMKDMIRKNQLSQHYTGSV